MSFNKDSEIGSLLSGLTRGYAEGRPTPLTPEQREEALKVALEFVTEANQLLGDEDKIIRTDPQGRNISLAGKKHIREVITAFRGADLVAHYYTHEYAGSTTYSRQHLYAFYPNRVDLHIRNSAKRTVWRTKNRYGDQGRANIYYEPEMRTAVPRGPMETVTEANAQELTGLLEAVKASKPWE